MSQKGQWLSAILQLRALTEEPQQGKQGGVVVMVVVTSSMWRIPTFSIIPIQSMNQYLQSQNKSGSFQKYPGISLS